MIGIIDYGVANLGSMRNMLRRIGADSELITAPESVSKVDRLILPGIGAFDQGMQALEERGLAGALKRSVLDNETPILGVCLGMQLLGESSDEGVRTGLGLVRSRCRRFVADPGAGVRVPHMGWGHIQRTRESPILKDIEDDARFYFVHSYHVVCSDPADVLATAEHGISFTAMIQCGHIFGAQFHPEKSHRFGMRLLKNFVGL